MVHNANKAYRKIPDYIISNSSNEHRLHTKHHALTSRTLRSSDTNLLSVPHVRTCFGSSSFSAAAPTIWNSLPFDIRNSCSIASFRRKLKTFYFPTSSHV